MLRLLLHLVENALLAKGFFNICVHDISFSHVNLLDAIALLYVLTYLGLQVALRLCLFALGHCLFLDICGANWAVVQASVLFILCPVHFRVHFFLGSLLVDFAAVKLLCRITSLPLSHSQLAALLKVCFDHVIFFLSTSLLDTKLLLVPKQSLLHTVLHSCAV